MKEKSQLEIGEQFEPEVIRTSENNMLCTVPYLTMTEKEQEQVDLVFEVAI